MSSININQATHGQQICATTGGFVWPCARVLLQFLKQMNCNKNMKVGAETESLHILELGSGNGWLACHFWEERSKAIKKFFKLKFTTTEWRGEAFKILEENITSYKLKQQQNRKSKWDEDVIMRDADVVIEARVLDWSDFDSVTTPSVNMTRHAENINSSSHPEDVTLTNSVEKLMGKQEIIENKQTQQDQQQQMQSWQIFVPKTSKDIMQVKRAASSIKQDDTNTITGSTNFTSDLEVDQFELDVDVGDAVSLIADDHDDDDDDQDDYDDIASEKHLYEYPNLIIGADLVYNDAGSSLLPNVIADLILAQQPGENEKNGNKGKQDNINNTNNNTNQTQPLPQTKINSKTKTKPPRQQRPVMLYTHQFPRFSGTQWSQNDNKNETIDQDILDWMDGEFQGFFIEFITKLRAYGLEVYEVYADSGFNDLNSDNQTQNQPSPWSLASLEELIQTQNKIKPVDTGEDGFFTRERAAIFYICESKARQAGDA